MLQLFRRLTQTGVILLIFAIPVISNYGVIISGKSQREFMDVARESSDKVLVPVYAAIHSLVDPEFNPVGTMEKIDRQKGGVWSLTLFGFNMSDPLSAVISILGSRSIYLPLLVSVIVPALLILLFGRFFCGWICPMGFILEMTDRLRNAAAKLGLPRYDVKLDRSLKYYILAGGLMLTTAGLSLLPYLLPYALVSREVYYWVFYQGLGVGAVIILSIILFETLVSKRGWCAYLCPGGAFFSALGAGKVVRIAKRNQGCDSRCFRCVEACDMGLSPREKRMGMECNNCGVCVSACPSDLLGYALKKNDQ